MDAPRIGSSSFGSDKPRRSRTSRSDTRPPIWTNACTASRRSFWFGRSGANVNRSPLSSLSVAPSIFAQTRTKSVVRLSASASAW